MTETPMPDPNDEAAVEYAAELIARSNVVRVAPGEVVTVRPGRFSRYAIGYSVTRLRDAEREWLGEYLKAAKAKHRAEREREREERRSRP